MTFKFEITNYNNAAMVIMPEEETARLLREVSDYVREGRVFGILMDANGNKVGEWSFSD